MAVYFLFVYPDRAANLKACCFSFCSFIKPAFGKCQNQAVANVHKHTCFSLTVSQSSRGKNIYLLFQFNLAAQWSQTRSPIRLYPICFSEG